MFYFNPGYFNKISTNDNIANLQSLKTSSVLTEIRIIDNSSWVEFKNDEATTDGDDETYAKDELGYKNFNRSCLLFPFLILSFIGIIILLNILEKFKNK